MRVRPSCKFRFWVSFCLILPLILFIGLAIIFFLKLKTRTTLEDVPSLTLERQIPVFSLPALVDISSPSESRIPGFANSDLLGKVSLVNIWASWCLPCREEHSVLMRIKQDMVARGLDVQILGINYKDGATEAVQFLKTHGIPYTRIGVDTTGYVALDWGIYGTPETFLIDSKGKIRTKFIGPLSFVVYEKKIRPALELFLREAEKAEL